jgi:CheY-like chemotaxis protein
VFHNLLHNACKYTEREGRVWFTAELDGAPGTPPRVVVRVRDTGLGIPPGELASVFEMFTQVDRSLERAQGGLGIGLTIVKRLVELHGGTVEARSEGLGRGSEFVVRLPVLDERQEPERSTATGDHARGATDARRFLVVDDNPDSAASLAMLLGITGHQTRTVHDGLAAVSEAGLFRPDVVLLDIGLPKLNGYDLARSLRARSGTAGSILVAVTGWGQPSDRQLAKEAGFDDYLVKPVDFDRVRAILSQ